MNCIELEVDEELKQFQASQVTKEQAATLRPLISEVYRTRYNPFARFAERLAKLNISPSSQAVINSLFSQVLSETVNLDSTRQDLMERATFDLKVVKKACILVTGLDLVTEKNLLQAIKALTPFLKIEEGVEMTMEQANSFRAKLGKPPIGVKEEKNG
jgi:hypothetical protein